jgi:hypothetical protein
MDVALLKAAGAVAGIAGVPLIIFFYLFRDIISKFTIESFKINQNQAYHLIWLIALLVWSIPVIGLGLWAYGKFIDSRNSGGNLEMSRTCKYTNGPRAGQIQYFPPSIPIVPAPVGYPCNDGAGSYGVAIKDQ